MPTTGTNFFPSTGSVRIALTDEFGNVILAEGTAANLPSATSGYALGGEYLATDTGVRYTNAGSTTSCSFVPFSPGTIQTLAAAGAVNLTTLTTRIDSAGAIALTLADGVSGQIKIIVMGTDGGDATLTPTTKTGYTTITFNDAGDGVVLVFITTKGWIVCGNNGATLA